MHGLAVHKEYDLEGVWTPLFKKLLISGDLESMAENSIFHRSLGLALELFSIDNASLLQSLDPSADELKSLLTECNSLISAKLLLEDS